jgi:hypothetical protein
MRSFKSAADEMKQSEKLTKSKKEAGLGDCEDIQPWIDLHDTEDAKAPRALFSR